MNVSHAQGEQLAQVRPAVTTAVTLFTSSTLRIEVTLLIACIRPAGAATVDITLFHDDDGVIYNDDSVIMFEQVTKNASGLIFQAQHPGSGILIKPGGSIGVQSSVANDVNFTLYGVTETIADRFRSDK